MLAGTWPAAELELSTRPVHPESRAALDRRWAELPEAVHTPAQTLGRGAVGCEGTHGVFPRCNLACTPCYHSRDANRVRVDGGHTQRAVAEQMDLLRTVRGPRAHTQLIGGEVSLLLPDDHAAVLQLMRARGREPMSMTHGDVDEDYLRALAPGPDGRRRLDWLSFAAHFDMMMFGRRGIPRPPDEGSLDPYRRAFAEMSARLRREHGVRSFLAHNMTVTAANVDQISGVVRRNQDAGFGMFSFQPAAFVGDERWWRDADGASPATRSGRRSSAARAPGCRFRALQHGDERCNRTAYGFYVAGRYHPLLDDRDPADLAVRDAYQRQHSVLDLEENVALRRLLPLTPV